MKLISFEFEDYSNKYLIEKINFSKTITLLTGNDCGGKYQVIAALNFLESFLKRNYYGKDCKWKLVFKSSIGITYIYETEILKGKKIKNNVQMMGEKVNVKYGKSTSYFLTTFLNTFFYSSESFKINEESFNENYNDIKTVVAETFTRIKDIRLIFSKSGNHSLEVKEYYSDHWTSNIPIKIYNSIIFIINTLTNKLGSGILIINDIENVFGLELYKALPDILIEYVKDLQLICTTNDPYVINNSSLDSLRICTMQEHKIKSHTLKDLGIEHSKHSYFMQMLQTKEFKSGFTKNTKEN